MDSLVIVESPTKEKTIGKFLSKNYLVRSSYGHVRDLPQRKLGVEIDKNFDPSYVVLPRAKKLLAELNKAAKSAKKIYLATDYDREGEAIAWHLAQVLKVPADRLRRITFHEITPEAIKAALAEPRDLDENLVNAQVARRVLDRLVGYKLSPLLWKKIKRGLSAGRVQSVAVRIICQRNGESL
jgi:DNA topoisomerase-1